MRLVASILLCVAALSAEAAEIYRWKDANGVTHFTDYPVAGAERVRNALPPPPPSTAQSDAPIILPNVVTPMAPVSQTYTQCSVTSPRNEETFRSVQPVSVQLAIQPTLQTGHRVQVFVNGSARADWPSTATSYTLPEVYRGSHAVHARVVDANGRILCQGPPVTFFLQQASVLSPLNPNNPLNRPPSAPRPPLAPPPTP